MYYVCIVSCYQRLYIHSNILHALYILRHDTYLLIYSVLRPQSVDIGSRYLKTITTIAMPKRKSSSQDQDLDPKRRRGPLAKQTKVTRFFGGDVSESSISHLITSPLSNTRDMSMAQGTLDRPSTYVGFSPGCEIANHYSIASDTAAQQHHERNSTWHRLKPTWPRGIAFRCAYRKLGIAIYP